MGGRNRPGLHQTDVSILMERCGTYSNFHETDVKYNTEKSSP